MNKSASRNSLFFIELIISIFFFILVATVCLQLFVKSHELSNRSLESSHAIQWCQNIAEIFLGYEGDFSLVKELYASSDASATYQPSTQDTFSSDSTLLLFLNQDWNICQQKENASYFILATVTQDLEFSYETIYVCPITDTLEDAIASLLTTSDTEHVSSEIIESLQVKKYLPTN